MLTALPRQAWVQGQMNGSKVDVHFDRTQDTISGSAHGDTVDVRQTGDEFQGSANGQPVALHQDWSPSHIHLQGRADGAPVDLDIDYGSHTCVGQVKNRRVDLQFDQEAGWIQGSNGNSAVQLNLSHDGHLSGRLNDREVAAEMINMDVGDFLSHFYLFNP